MLFLVWDSPSVPAFVQLLCTPFQSNVLCSLLAYGSKQLVLPTTGIYQINQKARKSPTISVVKVYNKGLTFVNDTPQDIPRNVCHKGRKLTEIMFF